MKRFIALLSLFFMAMPSYGQAFREWTLDDALSSKRFTLYEGVYVEPWPMFSVWHLNKVKTLDKGIIKAMYDVEAVIDTTNQRLYTKDRIAVIAGNQIIHSYGFYFWCSSMQSSVPESEKSGYARPTGYKDIINWFVYRDLRNGKILNYHALPLLKDYAISLEEAQPSFQWVISGDTDEILGYFCQKAETVYAGRHWTVWFTPEIPVDCGLWKFSGLPGLILKAADDNKDYSFSCIGVEKTAEDINIPTGIKVQRLKRDDFRRVEREHYLSPIQNSDRKNGYMLGSHLGTSESANRTALTVFTAENYTHPYFPMELE